MRRMKRTMAIVAMLMLLPGLAAAHDQTDPDPADTRGPFDTGAARLWDRGYCVVGTHPQRGFCGTEITLRLVTFDAWSSADISGGKNFITFELNLDADRQIERCVVVTAASDPNGIAGRPQAVLNRDCIYFNDDRIRDLGRVQRRDDRSMRIRIDKRHLVPPGTRWLRWRSATSFQRDGHEDCPPPEPHGDGGYGTCADFTDWKRHRL